MGCPKVAAASRRCSGQSRDGSATLPTTSGCTPRVRCIHKLSVAMETEERASVKPAHKLLAGLISILRLHLNSNVGGRH